MKHTDSGISRNIFLQKELTDKALECLSSRPAIQICLLLKIIGKRFYDFLLLKLSAFFDQYYK